MHIRIELNDHLKFFQGHFFQRGWVSVAQRSGDARDDCMVVCPSINSGVAYGGQCNWIYAVCDVTT